MWSILFMESRHLHLDFDTHHSNWMRSLSGITPLADSQDLDSVELAKEILMDKFLNTFIKGMRSGSLRVGMGVSMQIYSGFYFFLLLCIPSLRSSYTRESQPPCLQHCLLARCQMFYSAGCCDLRIWHCMGSSLCCAMLLILSNLM